MSNFGLLYQYELKKIIKNKLMIAMLLVMLAVIALEALAPGMVKGMDGVREEAEAQKTMDGRLIDDALLQEMYPKLVEQGRVWDQDNLQYQGIAYIAKNLVSDREHLTEYTAEEMYQDREQRIMSNMVQDGLTEGEIAWWNEAEREVTTPMTYRYYEGTLVLLQDLVGVLFVLLLIAALCLSTVFTVEHRQKTDQIVLSCKNGRKETYFAKFCAGISVMIGCAVLSTVLLTLLILGLYGLDGMNAVVQLEVVESAYPFTMKEFLVRQLIVMLCAGILFASFAMAVSELLKNSLAVMGIMVGIYLVGQLNLIPYTFRLGSQAQAMLPSNLINFWSLLEHRLIPLGGHYFTQYAIVPILYLVISALLIVAGWVAYHRFQVTGR